MSDSNQGIALYDFKASENDEISLRKGEVFNLIETYDDGWWLIEINSQQGVVPSNYVKVIDLDNIEETSPSPAKSVNKKKSKNPPLQLHLDDDEEETILSPPKLDFDMNEHDNFELSRLKEMREEATAKIDALR